MDDFKENVAGGGLPLLLLTLFSLIVPASATASTGSLKFIKVVHGGANYALDAQGRVWAWGLSACGNQGADTPAQGMTYTIPRLIPGFEDHHFVDVAVSSYRVFAVDMDGVIWEWGAPYFDNNYTSITCFYTPSGSSRSTNLSESQLNFTPVKSAQPLGVKFTSIVAGRYNAYALDRDGNAYAYGYGTYGQNAPGEAAPLIENTSFKIVAMPKGVKFSKLATSQSSSQGSASVLALTADGVLYGWGSTENGVLGDGYIWPAICRSPVKADTTVKFKDVSIQGMYAAGLDAAGKIYVWGYPSSTPILYERAKDKTFISVAPIDSTSNLYPDYLAVDSDGNSYGYGTSNFEKPVAGAGEGRTGSETVAETIMPADTKWQSITSGMVAIDQSGQLWGWYSSTPGDGTYTNIINSFRNVPVRMQPGVANVNTGSGDDPTTIACAPTTGVAPDGLTRYGLLAVSLLLVGLLVSAGLRRRLYR